MVRPPTAIRVAQVILWIEIAISFLSGILIVVVGLASSSPAVKAFLVVVALVTLAIGAILIWPTLLLGRYSRGARLAITILVGIGMLFDLLSLGRGGITGIVGLILGGVIIYCLWFNAAAKAAFDGSGPMQPPSSSSRWGG